VYFYDQKGELKRVPATWTSVVEADPFVVVAAGRAAFRMEDLLRLCDLIARYGEHQGCKHVRRGRCGA